MGMPGLSNQASSRSPQLAEEPTLSMSQSEALNRALEKSPAVRAEKVAQAKALLAGGSYPSDSDLAKVADLLAKNLGQREN